MSSKGSLTRDYGLRDQIRRASVSVMTNVAEGFDCDSHKEFARFLGIARRSAVEVQSLLYVALDVGHIDDTTFQALYHQAGKVKRLIGSFRHKLLLR
jgi:four helix bundle protein